MAERKAIKGMPGVYYRESLTRKWHEKADRCFWICFVDSKTRKLAWERCGWLSEGWTAQAAQRRRYELLEQDRAGEYKPARDRKQDLLTFGALMKDHYLPWSEANKRQSRTDEYLYRLWIEPHLGNKPLSAISPLDVERIKSEVKQAGKAPATVRHVLCVIRQAFNRAGQWGLYGGPNPVSSVKIPKVNNAKYRFLTHDEEGRLLAALRKKSPQTAQISVIALYSGLRLGEITRLKWGHIDRAKGIIRVLDTKTNEGRVVFLTPPVEAVLDELPQGEPDDLLFKSRKKDQVQEVSKSFDRVIEELGLNKGVKDRRLKITFHGLRHTWASRAVQTGVPLYTVAAALGHKTLTMSQRYAHLSDQNLREAFNSVASMEPESQAGQDAQASQNE